MQYLPKFTNPKNRLFTYKVDHDGGTAPNPFNGICTLAICKPRIRSVAISGDIVAGFGTGDESNRLVYVMVVEKTLEWSEYIRYCNDELLGKIPNSRNEFGDCIYELEIGNNKRIVRKPRINGSGHDDEDFYPKDVERGKNRFTWKYLLVFR